MASELHSRRVEIHSAELIRRAEAHRRAAAFRTKSDDTSGAGEVTRSRFRLAALPAMLLALARR